MTRSSVAMVVVGEKAVTMSVTGQEGRTGWSVEVPLEGLSGVDASIWICWFCLRTGGDPRATHLHGQY